MHIRKAFFQSFDHLKKNKKLVYPLVLSPLLILLLCIVYVETTPLGQVGSAYAKAVAQYQHLSPEEKIDLAEKGKFTSPLTEEQRSNFLLRALEQRQITDAGLTVYLQEQMGDQFTSFKNKFTFLSLFCLVLVIALIASYFSCASYVLLATSLRKQKTSYFFAASPKSYGSFLILRIIVPLLIFVLPLFLIIGITTGLSILIGEFTHYGFFLIPMLILAAIAFTTLYFVFMGLRLFFVSLIFFYEHKSIFDSYKRSYLLTQGRLKQVFLIGLFSQAILLFTYFLGFRQLGLDLLLFSSPLAFIATLLLLALGFILTAFVVTFQRLFLFSAYLEFIKTKTSRRK